MWDLILIQWLHVILSMLWLGGTLYLYLIMLPALTKLPFQQLQAASDVISQRTALIFRPVAILVIILGIIRGTLYGPIRSWEFIVSHAYGITWLISLILAILILVWSTTVTVPLAERKIREAAAHKQLSDEELLAKFMGSIQQVKLFIALELVGFLAIFTCMILMRFGL